MEDKMIGRLLSGRYEILEKIGTGGMANVYKAKCNVLKRLVAIKVLKEEFKDQEEFIKRFKTESRAVALLSHPNIVGVYDVGSEDGLPYIVMELIEGITLKEYIEQRKPLSYKEVILFSYQILKALEHAHSRKIIHRDIKPQNIMLLRDGTIKVADFGIARFSISNTQTMTETAIGSVHYISPEQAKGSVTDERSDIYSVGVVMYEMMTGQVPFDNTNPVIVAAMHLSADPQLPSEINPDVLPGLESITMHAMNREASLRYQNATQMINDLDALRENPDIVFNYPIRHKENGETIIVKRPRPEHIAAAANSTTGSHAVAREQKKPELQPAHREKPAEHPARRDEDEQASREKILGYIWLGVKIAAIIAVVIVLFNLYNRGKEIFNTLMETGDVPINISTGSGSSESSEAPREVEVPNLVGKRLADVQNDERYADFVIVEGGTDNSDEYDIGYIIDQDKKAGATVRPGNTIKVTVSVGAKEVKVLDVTNVEYRTAMLALKDKNFVVERIDENNDDIPVGYCIRTEPAADELAADGATVKVYVSLGPAIKMVETPNVMGKTYEEARKLLTSAGFVIESVESREDAAEKGTVISQSVQAGAKVEEKTAVSLVLSDGMKKSMDYYINLPVAPTQFTVTIYVNGLQVYKGDHLANEGSLYVPISGQGSSMVEVYIDDRLHASELVKFD